jgi:spermidine/putrescine transport system permease protein
MDTTLQRPRRARTPYLLLLPGGTWLIFFYLVPAITMLSVSLQEGSLERGFSLTWHWSTYSDVLTRFAPQLVRSFEYGLVVTAICLLVGYPLAYTIAFRSGRWKNAILFLVILPFFVSFVIRTLSWKFILADEGFMLGPLKSIGVLPHDFRVLATPWAVIGGLAYNFLPFMVLPLYVALEKLDKNLLEAAEDLYSDRFTAFRKVTLPLSLPGVFAGSLLTFIPAVGDFVNAALLGGVDTTMIGNVIQHEFLVENAYPVAAAISFLLMAVMLIGITVYARLLGTEELTG